LKQCHNDHIPVLVLTFKIKTEIFTTYKSYPKISRIFIKDRNKMQLSSKLK